MTFKLTDYQEQMRKHLIDKVTESFKEASGYSAYDGGIDKWRTAAETLVNGILLILDAKDEGDVEASE